MNLYTVIPFVILSLKIPLLNFYGRGMTTANKKYV